MSEAKFTKGPWRVDDCGDVRSIDDGEVIAVVLSDTDEFKTAHLIAAAPELYEALVRMKQWCEDEVGAELPCDSIDVALAKARGEV